MRWKQKPLTTVSLSVSWSLLSLSPQNGGVPPPDYCTVLVRRRPPPRRCSSRAALPQTNSSLCCCCRHHWGSAEGCTAGQRSRMFNPSGTTPHAVFGPRCNQMSGGGAGRPPAAAASAVIAPPPCPNVPPNLHPRNCNAAIYGLWLDCATARILLLDNNTGDGNCNNGGEGRGRQRHRQRRQTPHPRR